MSDTPNVQPETTDASGDEIQTEPARNQPNDAAKDIFETHCGQLMDQFGEGCNALQVPTALAVLTHPQTGKPTIFVRGSAYTAAQLARMILIHLTDQVVDELRSL